MISPICPEQVSQPTIPRTPGGKPQLPETLNMTFLRVLYKFNNTGIYYYNYNYYYYQSLKSAFQDPYVFQL